jgi:uncharacterized membrane protein
MNKMVRCIIVVCTALAIFSAGFFNLMAVQAADTTSEKVELTCQYPVLKSFAGTTYTWDVSLRYYGTGSKLFNLKVTVPEGFNSNIIAGYGGGGGTQIEAITLDGTKTYGDSVKVAVTPYAWQVPPPGSYPVTFEATSGDITSKIDLTAVVTKNYAMTMTTPDGRLNAEATAGQDSFFTVVLTNSGTGDLQNVVVSCPANGHPAGWAVTAQPEKLETFKVGESKEFKITVHPTEKTIAGDYELKVMAEPDGKIAFANVAIRTTVLTPTIWGWVGVGIVVLVIVALAIIFIRFGRR